MSAQSQARANKRQTQEEVDFLGDKRKEHSAVDVPRQGARRPRVRVGRGFTAVLTERQRVVLNHRVRLPRAWGRILTMLNQTGMTMDEFVEGLSNEELVKGQVKDKNGTFRGAPPTWVPRAFHRACVAELMRRGKRLWQENYLAAIECMTDIAAGRGAGRVATPAERIKAAQFVIERLEGKVPEVLVIADDQPWQVIMDGIVADVSDEQVARGQKALTSAQVIKQELHDIVDAEIVDDPVPPPSTRSRRPRRQQ